MKGIHKKNFVLVFIIFKTKISILPFLFSIYKIVDSMDIYKTLNISIGAIMKNPGMLKFVPDPFKTEKVCKYAVKNYLIY